MKVISTFLMKKFMFEPHTQVVRCFSKIITVHLLSKIFGIYFILRISASNFFNNAV